MSQRQEADGAIGAALSALRNLDQHRNLHAAVPIALLPLAALVALVVFFRLVDLFLFLGLSNIAEVMPALFAFLFSLAAFIVAYVLFLVILDYLGFRDIRGLARTALAAFEFSPHDLASLQDRVRATRWNHGELFDRLLTELSRS